MALDTSDPFAALDESISAQEAEPEPFLAPEPQPQPLPALYDDGLRSQVDALTGALNTLLLQQR